MQYSTSLLSADTGKLSSSPGTGPRASAGLLAAHTFAATMKNALGDSQLPDLAATGQISMPGGNIVSGHGNTMPPAAILRTEQTSATDLVTAEFEAAAQNPAPDNAVSDTALQLNLSTVTASTPVAGSHSPTTTVQQLAAPAMLDLAFTINTSAALPAPAISSPAAGTIRMEYPLVLDSDFSPASAGMPQQQHNSEFQASGAPPKTSNTPAEATDPVQQTPEKNIPALPFGDSAITESVLAREASSDTSESPPSDTTAAKPEPRATSVAMPLPEPGRQAISDSTIDGPAQKKMATTDQAQDATLSHLPQAQNSSGTVFRPDQNTAGLTSGSGTFTAGPALFQPPATAPAGKATVSESGPYSGKTKPGIAGGKSAGAQLSNANRNSGLKPAFAWQNIQTEIPVLATTSSLSDPPREFPELAPQVLPGSVQLPVGQQQTNALPQVQTPVQAQLQSTSTMGTPAWADDMQAQLSWMKDADIQNAEIMLHPADLGSLEVSITMQDDRTVVKLLAASPHTRELLEASLPRLRELLETAGLQLEQGSVSQGNDQHRQQSMLRNPTREPGAGADKQQGTASPANAAVRSGEVSLHQIDDYV